MPLMGLVWINYRKTHASTVVLRMVGDVQRPKRGLFELVSVVCFQSHSWGLVPKSAASFMGKERAVA